MTQVNVPHHTHSRILASYVLEYDTLAIPTPHKMTQEFSNLLLDSCARIPRGNSDLLKLSLKSDAKYPISVHSYYYQESDDEFKEEIERFSERVHKVCQSTNCFTIGHSVEVLIDKIAQRPMTGSAIEENSFVSKTVVNVPHGPVDAEVCTTPSIRLPHGSTIIDIKILTYGSPSDCLFVCLFSEIVRSRKTSSFKTLHYSHLGKFPWGCNRPRLASWVREIMNGRKEQLVELITAARAFAKVLGFDEYLARPVSTAEFVKICSRLTSTGLRFILFDRACNVIAATPNIAGKAVRIMIEDNHYHVIYSFLVRTRQLCRYCLYYNNRSHVSKCSSLCHMCKTTVCRSMGITETNLKCQICKYVFRNRLCQSLHICHINKKCRYCKQYLSNSNGVAHLCNTFTCRVCGCIDECATHFCSFTSASRAERLDLYAKTPRLSCNKPLDEDVRAEEQKIEELAALTPLPPFKWAKTVLIYYDIETGTMVPGETQGLYPLESGFCNIMVPVVVCAQTECLGCVWKDTECFCGQQQWTFASTPTENCMRHFIAKLMDYTRADYQYKLIAHNGGRFDHHFLLREIATYCPAPDLFIRRGTAILGMKVKNITILDSFRFLQMSLREMPKAIGANLDAGKDYFPHTLTNWEALEKGLPELPEKQAFGYDEMSYRAKQEFDAWYAEQPRGYYDFRRIMVDYCQRDVTVLKLCCRRFICLWYHRFGFNPFETYTLPSTVTKSMIEKCDLAKLIPMTPYHGYERAKYDSYKSRAYLKVLERRLQVSLRTNVKLNPRFYPDGYTDVPRKIAVDFHGCYFHLCDRCGFNTDRKKYFTTSTYTDADGNRKCISEPVSKEVEEQKRLMKELFCANNGIEYIQVWEHEIAELQGEERLLYDETYRTIVHQSPFKSKLVHRDGLFGGRTEVFKLYHHCHDNEVLEYHDVNGLYPYVLMNGRFPLMDPEFHYRVNDPHNFLFSLDTGGIRKAALCQALVQAPLNLLLPVLPCRIDGKLKFGLCRKCMEDSSRTCSHTEQERCISGVWTSMELLLAIDNGYQVLEISSAEVYEVCAGPDTPGLPNPHREFVGKCMAAKAYAEKTGNKAGRFLAKLAANTYWGSLAKNADMLTTKFFASIDEFYRFLNSESVKIKELHSLGPQLKMSYRTLHEMIETPRRTSLITAIFVTSYARIILYNYMKKIGPGRVVYCDTDSVIWLRQRREEIPFDIGSECGHMSDEIDKDYPGGFIKRFVSLGPKSYAYDVHDSTGFLKGCMRMKGISFKCHGASLTFDNMRDLLDRKIEGMTVVQKRFAIEPNFHTLHHAKHDKKVHFTMDKRIVHENYTTTPFGYIQ